ncbi:O-antigen ligase family protein [Halostagnicola sp. A-GB9-2]|uniref:O-antigen ligase family protein n=1 Tax=Halostagnicola sp. A-GB9-2 TaxID=3048066 RepID=UPI0024C0BDE1|nr:O-antigen ligase family protein [Halostagnicola sp. A-GB9-2]MDJ1433108.1 O-antigen ligase family protein [Halostagnicola sp. A-GB9-2]
MTDSLNRSLDSTFAVSYVAFVFSGVYKSAGFLEWVPVDLTLLLGIITVAFTVMIAVVNQFKVTFSAVVITLLFSVFATYAVFTGFWTSSSEYYWSKSFRLIAVTGLAFGIGSIVIATSYRRLIYVAFSTTGLSTVTALETLNQYRMVTGNVELYPFGTNYLITGRVIGLGLILTVSYLIFSRENPSISVASLFVSVVTGYALLVSGARGPMVLVFGAVVLLVVTGVVTGSLPNNRPALVGYAIAVSLIGAALTTIAQELRGMRRILQLVEGPGSSLGTRFDYWTATIEAFGRDMWFFGEGLGSWPVHVYYYADDQYYPHNILLEVIFELGTIGFVIFVALVLYAVAHTIQEWVTYNHPTQIVLVVLLIYMLGNAMISGDLNENRYLFAILGVMAYSFRSPLTEGRRSASILQ